MIYNSYETEPLILHLLVCAIQKFKWWYQTKKSLSIIFFWCYFTIEQIQTFQLFQIFLQLRKTMLSSGHKICLCFTIQKSPAFKKLNSQKQPDLFLMLEYISSKQGVYTMV